MEPRALVRERLEPDGSATSRSGPDEHLLERVFSATGTAICSREAFATASNQVAFGGRHGDGKSDLAHHKLLRRQ